MKTIKRIDQKKLHCNSSFLEVGKQNRESETESRYSENLAEMVLQESIVQSIGLKY